ncbi:hypothetical protein [Chryseobacterium sp. OSA05B]|uniref:hypothetical protein n=1 Tax=Chryseobacterium sp. OSA05B TaxID=2862650 RepID=UPI001CC02EFE|nr:hypothetical protein [Chryseobacterium sp. OSA05B]
MDFNIYSFQTVQKILENNLDKMIDPEKEEKEQELPDHGNIRGKLSLNINSYERTDSEQNEANEALRNAQCL